MLWIILLIMMSGIFLSACSSKNNLSDKNLSQISKEKSQDDFGAAMPRLGYVNDKSLIMYDSTGVYLFDLLSNKLVDYVNFEEHELGGIQGDNPTFVAISKNGQSIYLYNNKVKLVYDTASKTFDYSDFPIDSIELWNPQIAQDSIENDTYYNVGGIFQMENDKKCFLAIRKNMTPNYGALVCVIADDRSEEIYTLFH